MVLGTRASCFEEIQKQIACAGICAAERVDLGFYGLRMMTMAMKMYDDVHAQYD